MTTEELLKPRIKCIAPYPGQTIEVGEIIYADADGKFMVYEDTGGWELQPEQYPHLFKKLEWWEERKEEDMPQYIKLVNEKMLEAAPDFYKYFYKVTAWKFLHDIWCAETDDWILRANYFEPATEEEFLNQQK